MHGLRIPSSTALLLCGGLQFAGAAAMAADCDGSSDPCSVDLGRVTASFAAGAASYGAEVLLVNGSDASFSPPQSLPALQVIHTAASDGFRIQPQLYAYVGGSGVQGLHEVVATLQFAGLSFTADPGYQVNGVQAVITGSFSLVGNGYMDKAHEGLKHTEVQLQQNQYKVGMYPSGDWLEGEQAKTTPPDFEYQLMAIPSLSSSYWVGSATDGQRSQPPR